MRSRRATLPAPHLLRAAAFLFLGACASAQRGQADVRPLSMADPAAWERVVEQAYENRGLAQVERVGRQWQLNVMCNGTHSTYIEDTGMDLAKHRDGYVRVRYRYVERVADVQCVKAPCPPARERRIVLEQITAVSATADEAREMARSCR